MQNNVQSEALGSKDDLADHELHNIPPLCLECAGPAGFMPDKFRKYKPRGAWKLQLEHEGAQEYTRIVGCGCSSGCYQRLFDVALIGFLLVAAVGTSGCTFKDSVPQ